MNHCPQCDDPIPDHRDECVACAGEEPDSGPPDLEHQLVRHGLDRGHERVDRQLDELTSDHDRPALMVWTDRVFSGLIVLGGFAIGALVVALIIFEPMPFAVIVGIFAAAAIIGWVIDKTDDTE